MNELKVIKVAEIRKKLSCIPGKLLLAVLAVIGINWEESLSYALTAIILKPVAKLIPGLSPAVLELLETTPTDAIINAGQLDLSGNSDVLNRIFANPLPAIIELILIYGIISYFYFFIKLNVLKIKLKIHFFPLQSLKILNSFSFKSNRHFN